MRKQLKAIIAAVVLCLTSVTTAFAEIGIQAGYVSTVFTQKEGDADPVSFNAFNGFEVGVNGRTKIIGNILSVKYGLNYTYVKQEQEPSSFSFSGVDFKFDAQTANHYLDIPLQLQAGIPLGIIRVFAYAGPKFVCGLSSKTTGNLHADVDPLKMSGAITFNHYNNKVKSDNLDKELLNKINEDMPESDLRRFDILLGGGVGVSLFHILTVTAGYDWGVINQTKLENTTLHRNQFNVSAVIEF